MTLIPELQDELDAAARRHASPTKLPVPARGPRRIGRRAVALSAIGLVAAASGAVAAVTDVFDPGHADRTPTSEGRSAQAHAQTSRGEMTVLRYRNRSGQDCMAAGRLEGKSLKAMTGSGAELPLREVGACDLRLDPVAAQVTFTREEAIVFGVAADDVSEVAIDAGGVHRTARPAADHAFIFAFPGVTGGRVALSATLADGSVRRLELADAPDLDSVNEAVRRNAPRP